MKLTKLTALLLPVFILTACDEDDTEYETYYVRTGIPVSAAQNVPNLPTAGSGTADINYNPSAKTMSYTLNWSNLTDSVIAIRICGPSYAGYNSPNLAFTGANPTSAGTTPHNVIQEFFTTTARSLHPKTGSFSSSLYFDEVKVKSADLMNGLYYFTIHTKTIIPPPATPPTSLAYRWFGEIRGQIKIR